MAVNTEYKKSTGGNKGSLSVRCVQRCRRFYDTYYGSWTRSSWNKGEYDQPYSHYDGIGQTSLGRSWESASIPLKNTTRQVRGQYSNTHFFNNQLYYLCSNLFWYLYRFGEVQEAVNAIVFLLSDKASMINGVQLPVDGGFLAT